ncbi:MAG TPA: DUF6457 domain-containing protein [Candidatus Acidoferrales bacterium]|nr:DUF6457 domain-containing protein [Candidatus Acidoferrales bacterium]
MNPFFDRFGAMLAEEANARGAAVGAPIMDDGTAKELLDLARVVAHSQERRFAPLACYLAGIAVATIQTKQPQLNVAEYVKSLRIALEPQEDSGNNPV